MRHLIAVLISTSALIVAPVAYAGGDAAKGKTVALEKGCAGCHGVDGNSPAPATPEAPVWPRIAGQGEQYLAKQLRAFRGNNMEKGGRVDPTMAGFASSLTDDQIDDLSAYFASQKAKTSESKNEEIKLGLQIFRGGDKTRGVPSCMGCHGPTGAGNPASGYPRLAGQWAAYTEAQLLNFKSEVRVNDQNKMMQDIASKMTRAEIKAVSNVIQGLHD
ncbi:MAG: cytochrome c4 [Gammaproteobacteria bacterium]|nr:cytochrome c4 [Gammaproteobacteria bacterium]